MVELYLHSLMKTSPFASLLQNITNECRKERNAYRILVGKPEGKRPLGRPRRRWVDNIKLYLRDRGWDGMGWIDLAQSRDQRRALVNTVMNLRGP
jgi:hypothetical protein